MYKTVFKACFHSTNKGKSSLTSFLVKCILELTVKWYALISDNGYIWRIDLAKTYTRFDGIKQTLHIHANKRLHAILFL